MTQSVERKSIGTSKNMKRLLADMGFYSTRILGVWKFSETLSPGNTLEVCVFTHGNFRVNEHDRQIYKNNYNEISVDELVAVLFKIINKVT
jgi:hypothetical protein